MYVRIVEQSHVLHAPEGLNAQKAVRMPQWREPVSDATPSPLYTLILQSLVPIPTSLGKSE